MPAVVLLRVALPFGDPLEEKQLDEIRGSYPDLFRILRHNVSWRMFVITNQRGIILDPLRGEEKNPVKHRSSKQATKVFSRFGKGASKKKSVNGGRAEHKEIELGGRFAFLLAPASSQCPPRLPAASPLLSSYFLRGN